MKVSVIMPFHKGVHFLEDALESLRDQSFKDFELVLICDHVKEDIDKYVEEYSKDFSIVLIAWIERGSSGCQKFRLIPTRASIYIFWIVMII